MFSAEDQQVDICLLKLNLEEIGNELVVQRTAIPALEAQTKKKNSEALAVLRVVRTLNLEIEKLKQDGVRLTAKRVQLKRQSDELSKSLEEARRNRDQLATDLKKEDTDIELEIRRYEDSLQEKADRFRKTHGYYDETEVIRAMKSIIAVTNGLEKELEEKQSFVNELKKEAEVLSPEVTEHLLENCGQQDLEEKVEALISEYEALSRKRKAGKM